MESSQAQMANSSLKETMAELKRCQTDFVMVQDEIERSMVDMDNYQVGLPRFHAQNEIIQPPQEEMTNLEVAIVELKKVQAEFAIPLAKFIEEVNQPPREESMFENEVGVLAISMAKFANSITKSFMEETKANVQFQSIPLKSLEETMTPKAISYTRSKMKKEQHPHRKEMSIGELMAQHMNEGQQESLPTILKVNLEQEMDHYEDITLRNGGEFEKAIRKEDDANELKELVAK